MRYTLLGLAWLLIPALAAAQDKPLLVPNIEGHTARVSRVRFTPDGRQLISVSQDKTIRIWDLNSGQTVRVLRPPIGPGQEGLLAAAAIAPDGKTLAVGGYPVGGGRLGFPVYLIELPAGRITRLLHGHKDSISDLAFSPDGKWLASTSYDRTLRIWKTDSEEKEKILEGHEHYLTGVAWSPDGKRLATGSFDRTGRIWSLADGQCDAVLKGHTREVHCVAWSRDGKWIATGGEDRAIRMWSPEGKPGKAFQNLGNRITSLTFTRLSKALLVTRGSPDSLDHTCSVLWHGTGEERTKFTKHTDTVTNGTLSPSGRLAATCGGFSHEIYIWQIADGALWNRLGGRSRGIMSAGWNRPGTVMAWGNTNKGSTLQANLPLERTFRPANLESDTPPDPTFRRAELNRGSLNLVLEEQQCRGPAAGRRGGADVQALRGRQPRAMLQLPDRRPRGRRRHHRPGAFRCDDRQVHPHLARPQRRSLGGGAGAQSSVSANRIAGPDRARLGCRGAVAAGNHRHRSDVDLGAGLAGGQRYPTEIARGPGSPAARGRSPGGRCRPGQPVRFRKGPEDRGSYGPD